MTSRPGAVARKVDSLSKLLDARQQLQNLVTYMDGKGGAEELIGQADGRPGPARCSLASSAKPSDALIPPMIGAKERSLSSDRRF